MVGIYIKVNEEALQKEKIQLDSCKSLLDDKDEFEVYSDLGNTRVAREELLNKINNGYITSIITYDFSRLSRNQEEVENILKLLNSKNVKLITFENGDIDKCMFSIFSDLNKIEKSKISAAK